MTISVVDFNREIGKEWEANPFSQVLKNPIFDIIVFINDKLKIFTLKIAGEIDCPLIPAGGDFEPEFYRNYLIIANFLLGEDGEGARKSWGLSKKDFRELIFSLYFALIKEHATCSFLKRAFLYLMGKWKFFIRKV